MTAIHGWDLSLNHSGFVEVDEETGEVVWFTLITEYPKVAAMIDEATYYDAEKHRARMSTQDFKLHRMAFFGEFLRNEVLSRNPQCAAVENYSFGSRSNSKYEIGEIGGIARDNLIAARIPFRLWGPLQLKQFAGIKKSEKPIAFCKNVWHNDWAYLNLGLKTPQAAGDVADANVLAMMALAEYRYKNGGEPVDAPGYKAIINKIDGVPWHSEQMLREDESYL